MNGRILDLHLCVSGRPLPEYHHNGGTYLEGRSASDYAIRLRNRTARRIEVVLTVDGLDVITGEEGSALAQGYVLDAYQTTDIKGFSRGREKAAAFRFAGKEMSYRAQMGKGSGGVGVIGAAVYEERAPVRFNPYPLYPPYPPYVSPPWILRWQSLGPITCGSVTPNGTMRSSASVTVSTQAVAGMPTAQTQMNVQNLGTEYGSEVEFHTGTTAFGRATDNPAETLVLYYDDAVGLAERGVVVGQVRPTAPSAFPADGGAGAPPPPGWSG